jgi:hypothetical protein
VKVPPELVGTWVSAGMGDAVQQYDFYANGTYQFVGITRQAVSNGVFEFEVFHEGAATVDGDSITFEAFRGTARRDHPEHPSENYADDLRPQTATSHWRLQPRGGERYLVLGDGATPAVVYRFLGRSSTPVRARNRPPAPTRVGADTASGELVEWFPLFGEEVSARVNRRTGWKVLSTPGDPVVHVFDPGEVVHDVDVSGIPKNGTFVSFSSEGRRLPIEIGWYPGGTHRGTRQDGTYGPYTVPAGYVARWVDAP